MPNFPRVAGYGSATPDGAGGWFISGNFTGVGGLARASLAHVLADGSIGPWSPAHDGQNISCLALADSVLYVSGDFTVMDGQSRSRVAAFNTRTGELTSWNPDAEGAIFPWYKPEVDVLLARGDTIFAGGQFTQIGGQARAGLAALDAKTGLALNWNPGAANSYIDALAIREGTLFVGGHFRQLGGQPRSLVAAVDIATGVVTPWNPAVTGPDNAYVDGGPTVYRLLIRDSTVYFGGRFNSVGGQPRSALAAVSASTGTVLPWRPDPIYNYAFPWPYVLALAARNDTIFVGGSFDAIGGKGHSCLAAVDAHTGVANDWNPRPNQQVRSLVVDGSRAFVGGNSALMLGTWQNRSCLAALDLSTGTLKPWDPAPNGLVVNAIAASGGVVYVGGDFTSIGGQARHGIAALDTLAGAATSWNPMADGQVRALILHAGKLYAGGGFWDIGGQTRHYAAALDTATGQATAWNPSPSDWVLSLAASGGTIYLGGFFNAVGGVIHHSLAAVDTATGVVSPWTADTGPGEVIEAMGLSSGMLYVGGQFETMEGQPRNCLAAIDTATGQLSRWDPLILGLGATGGSQTIVHALAVHGHTIYAGGDFYTIGGKARPCLAALDDSVGAATAWTPLADSPVWSLAVDGGTIYAGGSFWNVGLLPMPGFAALSIPDDPVTPPLAFDLGQNFPNPAHAATSVRFTLPTSAVATLSIFDVQGRRIATPLARAQLQAGQHIIPLKTEGWMPGMYLYRLETGGRSATRKMLLVR